MHILGKVCAWLIVLLTLTASVLTARMLQVRNSWAKKTNDLKTEYVENRKQLDEKQKRLRSLQQDLARTLRGWNEYWNDIAVDVLDPQVGTIRAALGSDRGIKQNQTLYAFEPDENGQGAVFVGPFVVESVRQGQSGLRPAWRYRPGEPEKWRYGPGWRFRVAVPTAVLAEFRDLERDFTVSDENLDAKQRFLTAQQQEKQTAQMHLDFRLSELHGGNAQPPAGDNAEQAVPGGLAHALEDQEEARNNLLVEVDALKRQLKVVVEEYQRLSQENAKLAEQLTKPDVSATAKR